ncbi:hypothetical protein KJ848_01640 [Patescibacteria group bacterium]|nr:hypothetical protein [Patescibacteria group bacterium]MBU2158864.1 hypothetical protein [Patescibacteria group bacterium]
MDTVPVQQVAEPSKGKKYVIVAIVVVLAALLVAGLVWLMFPYLKEQYVISEGAKREGYLEQLPNNPAATDLTFEDRQNILSGE